MSCCSSSNPRVVEIPQNGVKIQVDRNSTSMRKIQSIKLTLLGESGVGKSSIVLRLVSDAYQEKMDPTIGSSFALKNLEIDDRELKIEIWDTAGSERFRTILPMYYRQSHAALIVYDISDKKTFDQIEYWYTQLLQEAPSCVVFIVGNKSDLEHKKQVKIADAQQLCKRLKCSHVVVSCKTGENIKLLSDTIGKELIEVYGPILS
eukprot:TRINITY_DN5687_c0_g1_i1.p1 TRINITY_DN5687_c0_g1~~TRINITY_DN5687_c0_g1_i1.p1  ORF type:complete len:205 (-),score=25.92 TRINITY_DN5687_c0_g1_i1:88-702(-)